ncbi:MAG: DNA repair protein RadA [Burkholderiales bacterium]
MTQITVLNDIHRRFGAKMVDFGGWDMPLHYGSQIEEHHAVRRDCGMFDVSHMCAVDIAGPDAKAFLLRLIANNVDKLKLPGKALYSAMLNESGGVVDDLIVYFIRDGQYRMVVNAGTAEEDLAWMAARVAEWDLEVAVIPRRDLAIIAVQGPNAKAKVWQVLPETRTASEPLKPFFSVTVGDYFVASTGYTGEDGFEISIPAESAEQVALRARRLGISGDHVDLFAEIRLESIQATLLRVRPAVAVIDSIQTIYSGELTSAPGSVSQVKECAAQLTRLAKQTGIPIVMIGHVTKDGTLAGPRVLEHIVDTVLYFEGDTHSSFRLVRAFKNRFGAVNELGVFAMTDRGLRGVANPSALFLSRHATQVSGTCVMATQEGTRPLLVEIQALVDTAHVPNPRRLSVGLEGNRLAMLLAVLHRHAGVSTSDQDVFVNAVGGVRITEPAADLPVLLAIMSSLRDRSLPEGLVAFGEVGLAGEVRPAPRGQERLREAAKLGFSIAIIPKANAPRQPIEGLEVWAVDRLQDALDRLRQK